MPAYMPCEANLATTLVAQIAAATATQKDPIFTAPRKCVVLEIALTPQTATTGNNTNTKTLNVVNVGPAGAGTTQISTTPLPTGTNLVAGQKQALALNAANAAGHAMAAGETLSLETVLVGTGVIVGPHLVSIVWAPLE